MTGPPQTTLELFCPSCDWAIPLPDGTPTSALRSDCPECDGDAQVRQADRSAPTVYHEIMQGSMDAIGDPTAFDFLPGRMSTEAIANLDYAESPDKVQDMKTISGFVNRITPVILAAQVLAEMMEAGTSLEGELVVGKFADTSVSYRKALRRIEDENDLSRGMRLSDGFPEDEEKSIRRFTKAYIGADTSGDIADGSGLTQQLGLIALEYGTEEGEETGDSDTVSVRLTEAAKGTLPIKIFSHPEIDSEKHRAAGAGQVTLPRWLSRDDVGAILSLIQERSNAEHRWMRELLNWINASYEGRTTSELIDLEIEREMSAGTAKRWFNRGSNTPLVEEMGARGASDEEITEKLSKKIYSTMSGTLARMKELSLIFQFRRGRRSYYKSTKSGNTWVKRWDKDDRE